MENRKWRMMRACSGLIRGCVDCYLPAKIKRGGKYYCGIHDPDGLFQAVQRKKFQDKQARYCCEHSPRLDWSYCPYCGTKI